MEGLQMFCYQCEQTSYGTGCSEIGVCGKDPETAALQDLLVHAAKGVSMFAHRAAELGNRDSKIDLFVIEGHGHRVFVHVGFDRGDVVDLLDGRTGRRSGAASNDSGRAEHVGHRCRGRGGDEEQHCKDQQRRLDDLSCSHR